MSELTGSITINLVRATGDDLLEMVRGCCETQHYLHRWPDPRSLPFAYALQVNGAFIATNGLPNGVLVFKKPQHHRQHGLFGYPGQPTAWQVLDMARVWINPLWQRPGLNLFSRMVSLGLRRVQWGWLEHHPPRYPDLPYHVTLILSYCEKAHHDGTAYRACSFVSAGLSRDKTKELYYRRLRAPLKAWRLPAAVNVQLPLMDRMPLRYE